MSRRSRRPAGGGPPRPSSDGSPRPAGGRTRTPTDGSDDAATPRAQAARGPRPTPPGGGARRSSPAARREAARRTVEETSAGGLVVDRSEGEPRVAVIARLNRAGRLEWCLPKGHLEGQETPEQAAVREIAEETGIHGRVLTSLGSIDYWFSVDDLRIHKTVHHYLLEATGGHLTVEGDPDAEAVDVAWVPVTELGRRLSFVNERRIARTAGGLLADSA